MKNVGRTGGKGSWKCTACDSAVTPRKLGEHSETCEAWKTKFGAPLPRFKYDPFTKGKKELYEEVKVEGVDYVVCQECLQYGYELRFSRIAHHLKAHDLNLDSYQEKYPDAPVRLKKTLERRKATTRAKYGVDNAFQSEELKEKGRKTMLAKYGVEHNSYSKETREKRAATNLERYGAENVFGSAEIQERSRKTLIEKYGADNPNKVPEIIEKRKATNLKRYGTTSFLTSAKWVAKLAADRVVRAQERRQALVESGRYEECPHCKEMFTVVTSRHKAICSGWPDTILPEPCLCGHESTSHTQMKRHRNVCAVWQGRDAEEVARERWLRTVHLTHGVQASNPRQIPGVEAKRVETLREVYGAENVFHRDSSIFEKVQQSLEGKRPIFYGEDCVFTWPDVKEKILRTCLAKVGLEFPEYETEASSKEEVIERYGILHPMENREWSAWMLQNNSPLVKGINKLEQKIHDFAPSLRYMGDQPWYRWLPRLRRHKNPDFVVPGPNKDHPLRDISKVVEAFGDYWHGPKVTGMLKKAHETELVEAYADIGIECLVLWEGEVKKDPDSVKSRLVDFLSS